MVVLVVGPWAYTGAVSGLFVTTPGVVSQLPVVGGTPLDALSPETESLTPTLTFTPAPEPILYEVRAGDSLSAIALRYEVTQADIMAANGLTDPDTLQAGQILLIPVGGVGNATPTFTPAPLATDTPIPFDPPTPEGGASKAPLEDVTVKPTETPTPVPTATAPPFGEVRVIISQVLGYGQLEQEVVVISNEGPGVNLLGWKIVGSKLGEYNFPNLFLWNGGFVHIHTTTGANTPGDLYWGQDEAGWFSGDRVELVDASGVVVSSYTIP
jgi:LysM repeat protein